MKAVILAGGLGTRLSEETDKKPKPMVEIGGKPILWHIMKIYSSYGVDEFIVCCGYKSYVIKEFFANYMLHSSDVTISLKNNTTQIHRSATEPWEVSLVDTGDNTNTGGRLKRIKSLLNPDEPFFFTYGDGVANVDVNSLLDFHKTHGALATVTATRLPARYGALDLGSEQEVANFNEKPEGESGWINGGFFVCDYGVMQYISGDETSWEGESLPMLTKDLELKAYLHHGFWKSMDTLRDKVLLEQLWQSGSAPWMTWREQ